MSSFDSVVPTWRARLGRHAARCGGVLLLASAAVLSACGGAERVETYTPTRIVSFGDELSLITTAGKAYSINGVSTTDTTAVDCTLYPTWNQAVASTFGLAFPECAGTVSKPTSVMRAAVGAKVADVVTQVQQFQATDTFAPPTLVTLLVGQYDVLDAYNQVLAGTLTRDAALTQVSNIGMRLAALVNNVANTGSGARVIYSTIPDLAKTPWGLTLDSTYRTLLTDLTNKFNTDFRFNVLNEGRYAGLVKADAEIETLITYPSVYGVTDVVTAGCTAALPNCTTATLQSAAASSAIYYLWADSTRPGAAFHIRLGTSAISRARNNPF